MSKPNVNVGRQILMRDAGLDERWLQEVIANDPSVLGLGELEYVDREIRQPTGGRLDLLFRNPEDNAMYEVEVMLGDTDPEHIIRTIEYWDVEKRRYPKRQHTAVLVGILQPPLLQRCSAAQLEHPYGGHSGGISSYRRSVYLALH